MIPFAVWQPSKTSLLYTSGTVCCFHVRNLKLAQNEHSWSVLFPSIPSLVASSRSVCLFICYASRTTHSPESCRSCSSVPYYIFPLKNSTLCSVKTPAPETDWLALTLTNNMTPGVLKPERNSKKGADSHDGIWHWHHFLFLHSCCIAVNNKPAVFPAVTHHYNLPLWCHLDISRQKCRKPQK